MTVNNIIAKLSRSCPEAVLKLASHDHVSHTFLNLDDAAAFRDAVDNLRQSAFEIEVCFTRRLREVAQNTCQVRRYVD